MTAVEVLKWLITKGAIEYNAVFNCCDIDWVFKEFTAQEIVDRIEKYEAEKKYENEEQLKKLLDKGTMMPIPEQEFKVGDWVTPKTIDLPRIIAEVKNCDYVIVEDKCGKLFSWNINDIKHAEPPREEKCKCGSCKFVNSDDLDLPCGKCNGFSEYVSKEENQKIERFYFDASLEKGENLVKMWNKINELVNAVNELRGAE